MDLEKLKSVYDAARSINGHKQEEAAPHVGKSSSMINQTLSGTATSMPTIKGIIRYIEDAGLGHILEREGLYPESFKKKVTAIEA